MTPFQRTLLCLVGGTAISLATLLALARTDIKWPFRNGYVKVLPGTQWPRYGGCTRFTRQQDGTYHVRRVTYHIMFCFSRTIHGEEVAHLLAKVSGRIPND